MKIYFASGWFTPEQMELMKKGTEATKRNKTIDYAFYPFENQGATGHEFGTREWADDQYLLDVSQLQSADVVVVALTTENPDSGTAMEQGMAIAYNKPVVYVTDGNSGNLMNVMGNTVSVSVEELAELDFNNLPVNHWEGAYI